MPNPTPPVAVPGVPPQRSCTGPSSVLTELAGGLRGELAVPGDATYARLTAPFNAAVAQRPVAVVAAADAYDVVHAVRLAGRRGLRVAVQCTGHGAAASIDDVLLVHTGAMDECSVAPEGWARVGAGVRWRAVVDAAAPLGLTPLAGSSSGVGVVGYTTGGGLGPLALTYGLASDRVRAFDVVTGGGSLVRATPTEHADLFWALRGGQGAAGIVTAVEFDLVALRSVYGGALHFAGDDAAALLHRWRAWAPELPPTATTSIALRRLPPLPHVPPALAGRLTVAVRVVSTAGEAEAGGLLDPLLELATPVLGRVGVLPVTGLDVVHGDPQTPVPSQERSTLLRALTADTADALLAEVGPGSGTALSIVELRQLGGQVARPPEHDSAVCGRSAAHQLHTIGLRTPQTVDAVTASAQRLMDAVAPWSAGTTLPTFGGGGPQAYDADTLDRLRAVVRSRDPGRVLVGADALLAQAPSG